jgi:mono/diheme cytochrome c family protein
MPPGDGPSCLPLRLAHLPVRERTMRVTPILLSLLCLPVASAAEPAPSAEQVRFFESRIRPLLAANCFACHGPQKQKGGLRLDTAEGLRRGGDSGPVAVPGQLEQSLIVKAIRYADPQLQMPPKGKLPDRDIADLAKWVRTGAVFPQTAATVDPAVVARTHWAFRPPAAALLPRVKDSAWVRTPVDRFILARLEAAGLRPAVQADRRTLLRRVTFDLIGLPPTPDEVEAFLADTSPDAFAGVVDRLLASPAYGERWGRHWLDVGRYSDSNGLDENIAHGNAWRYRDYVVRAFNADKPYDHFLLEQIAGDLLPSSGDAQRHEQLIATGFLALGPKVLAEVDEVKMEMDIIDEQLDTLGRAVLGLTVGCARCHDHKFDPLTQEDYYALAGIFKSTRTMENFTKIARWHENPLPGPADLARKAEHDRQVARQKDALAALVKQANEKLLATLPPGSALPAKPESSYPEATKAELKKLRDELAALEKKAPEMPSAMGVGEREVKDLAVHLRGSHLTLGKVMPRRLPLFLAASEPALGKAQSGRLELAHWLVRPDHPLTARVLVNRVWRGHFGRGLVPTPDNFGRLGEPPTHPELLDWLATRFVETGWSIKALHREIVLSSTYQQASIHPDAGAAHAADPDNRLWWRQDVRRLEAEPIRDAILAVSGLLDRQMGASMLHVRNREFFFDHTSKDTTTYDSNRRSLYLPVVRNHLYDFFQLFDFPDPAVACGDRATTTIAPQALFWLNSNLVLRSCDALAARLQEIAGDDSARIGALYLRAYGRLPSDTEVKRLLTLLADLKRAGTQREPDQAKRERLAWALVCQVVLSANEFISIR